MNLSSTTYAYSRQQTTLTLRRGRSAILGSVILTIALTACMGPIKPVPAQQSQEASPPPTATADASETAESASSEPSSSTPAASPMPLPPIGSGLPIEPQTQEEVPVVEAKPVLVVAARESYNAMSSTTATRTNTPLMQTPASVQVVPKAVIDDQQAITLQDALKNVSGVQPTATAGEYDNFLIRGFSTEYALFRNGTRLTNLTYDLANVERIEILKGPAAMLYGRIEPGGMINVVTQKPLDTPSYSIQQQFGSYGLSRTVVNATGPLTSDGALAYRIDLGYRNNDSFRDFVGRERLVVAPSLRWRPTSATEFNLSAEYIHDDYVQDNGIPARGNRVANVPISTFYNQPGFPRDHIEGPLVDFNWSHKFNENWTIKNGIVARFLTYKFRSLPVAYFQPLLEDPVNPMVRRGIYSENFHRNTYNAFLDLNGKFDTWGIKHNVLIGGDYYQLKETNSGFSGVNALFDPVNPVDYFTNVNLFNPVYPQMNPGLFDSLRRNSPNDFGITRTSWFGLYFQDQITLWDTLHILGGGRYDWARLSQGFSTASFNDIVKDTVNEDKFSPRVGVVYQPWPWLSLYGNYSESFGATNSGRTLTGQPLAPKTANQYEGGVKAEFFDGQLTSTLAFYRITQRNLPVQVTDLAFAAVGKARSQGIELDIAGQLGHGVSLIATYAYTDAAIVADQGLAFDNLGNIIGATTGNQGRALPNVPLHSGSVWLKYAVQQAPLQGLSVGTGVYLASERQGSLTNSYQLPGYARLDAYAAYRMKLGPTRLTAQVNVNNVLNQRYFYASHISNFSEAYNMPGEPLMVIGSLRLEY